MEGKPTDAIQLIVSGIAASAATGTSFSTMRSLIYLARAYGELGKFDDAWRSVGEAMTAVEVTSERWFEAEVHRVAGEITLARTGL